MPFFNTFYLRNEVVKFVVLFVERSGSTYLATLLDSHPNIHALREQFASLMQEGKGAKEQLMWASAFYTPSFLGRNRAYGFKTKMVDILDKDGFAKLLKENDTRILALTRRNTVKGVVSTINAKRLWEKTGNWNLLNESDRTKEFSINPEKFKMLLNEREQWDRELNSYVARLELPTLDLFYEDLLRDEQEFITKVFDFLGVKARPVEGRTLKHTKDDLRQVITNFDELRSFFTGTQYEPMFDEILI